MFNCFDSLQSSIALTMHHQTMKYWMDTLLRLWQTQFFHCIRSPITAKRKFRAFFPCNVYESTLEMSTFMLPEQLLFFPHSNEYFYSTNYVLSAGNFTSIISCL